MFPIELQFLSYDPKRTTCHLTLYCPVEYIIRNRVYSIWKLRCRDHLLYSREGCLVVRPVKNPTSYCLRLRQRKILLCYRLIVSKRTHRTRKELSPLSICYHLLDYLRHELLILFLSILLVEDTVGLVAKLRTEEEIGTSETVIRITHIIRIPCTNGK